MLTESYVLAIILDSQYQANTGLTSLDHAQIFFINLPQSFRLLHRHKDDSIHNLPNAVTTDLANDESDATPLIIRDYSPETDF